MESEKGLTSGAGCIAMAKMPVALLFAAAQPSSHYKHCAHMLALEGSRLLQPNEVQMATSEPGSCRVIATSGDSATYSLQFELNNQGSGLIEFSIYEPFTAFSLLATSDNKPVTVYQPALDIPVNRRTIRLPPGAFVTIHTPIRLRIAEDAEPGTDGFLWTIKHPKEMVSLHVKLDLPPPFAVRCPLLFQ
jgi:hypothetical protein